MPLNNVFLSIYIQVHVYYLCTHEHTHVCLKFLPPITNLSKLQTLTKTHKKINQVYEEFPGGGCFMNEWNV